MSLTDVKRIESEAKLEVCRRMYQKGTDIKSNRITASYFCEEINREIGLLEKSLQEVVVKKQKIDVIKPKYGPGDEVRHTVTDTPSIFTVMEVNHGTQEYKLTSNYLIKTVTVVVGWGELDESK